MIPELFKNNDQLELWIDDYMVSTHSNIEFNNEQIIKAQILINQAIEYAYQKGKNDKLDQIENVFKKGILPNADNN